MNKIPRNFKSITATVLSGNAKGIKMVITKSEYSSGYTGREENGKLWHVFPSHLRNENFYRIDLIEKEA